ncbi:MAG: hypothetical protein GY801_47480 [bacterium]|nr:hypothetical protein [bacterium]
MKNIVMKEIKEDISLKKYALNSLPVLQELRKQHFETKIAVCIERAKYITEYMKTSEDRQEPMELRRAKAVNHYLSNREIIFHDDNWLAGSSTSKPIGAPVYPELFGLSIWPELETISTRKENPQLLSKEDADILNFDVYPYWMDRTVLEVTRAKIKDLEDVELQTALKLMEKIAFFMSGKTTTISHTTPYYVPMLHQGLDALIKQAREKEETLRKNPPDTDTEERIIFYQAMQIAMQGILNYAKRLSEKAAELAEQESSSERKKYFQTMAEICAKVPANPAETYREALNSLWLCHVGVLAENVNMALNPGRLDQILYPFFKNDIENNNITIEEALTLTGSLWFKIADNTNLVPQTAERLFGGAGSVPAVTLGGVDQDGNDAINDLTYIMLRITELLSIKDPNVNARYHNEMNAKTYRDRVCEVIINTKAIPAFYNDVSNIATLQNQGISLEHARDYAIIGCVELGSAGREYAFTSAALFNLNAAVEMTLFNGKRPFITGDEQIGPETGNPENFQTFDEFWNAFETQLTWLIQRAIDLNDILGKTHQKILPTPLLSCFIDGPMEKGKDVIFGGALYNSSGFTHIAFADVCDSLNAIEYAVFKEKKVTMQKMIEAVDKNFKAPLDKSLLPYLKHKAPKFGTEDPIAVKNSRNLIKLLYNFYQQHTNYRGGKYRPAFWTMTNHAGQGKISEALPSGRKARTVFSSGITPTSQCAPSLTETFGAVAKLSLNAEQRSEYIPGGVALNIKYTPEGGNGNYLKKFGDMIEAYFKQGGIQVQFNVQTYETLIDAKKHPKKYPELIVRVSGYSAYFKDLNDAMKDELITRSQYNLFTGQLVPLPESFQEGGE